MNARMPWRYGAGGAAAVVALGARPGLNVTNWFGLVMYFTTLAAVGYFIGWLWWRNQQP